MGRSRNRIIHLIMILKIIIFLPITIRMKGPRKMNIEAILKKDKWTADEVGKVAMANALTIMHESVTTGKTTPLVDQNTLMRMVDSLVKQEDLQMYARYQTTQMWLYRAYNEAESMENIALYYMERMNRTLDHHLFLAYHEVYMSAVPKILTTDEYNAIAGADNKNDYPTGIAVLKEQG